MFTYSGKAGVPLFLLLNEGRTEKNGDNNERSLPCSALNKNWICKEVNKILKMKH